VRNSSASGAGVGVTPTTWQLDAGTGVTTSVVAVGTEFGVPYVDIRINGTNSSGSSIFPAIRFEATLGAIPASAGQTWTASCFAYVVAGSMTGLTSPGFGWGQTGGSPNTSFGTPTLDTTRTRSVYTATTPAGTTSLTPRFAFTQVNGATVDVTLRISLPQIELGAFATSPIITTGAAGTRGADTAFVAGLAGLPPFTFFTEGDTGASSFPQYGAVDDGTSANRVSHLRIGGGTNSAYAEIHSGGGSTGANVGPTGVVFAGQTTKIASSVTSAGLRASRDGSAIATAARTVNALNRLCVGNATGTLPANGYVQRIRVLPFAATDAQLQALTAP
jgi:hypothetical protein